MSEPTREQIKEAFKETIERWEKIVGDVEYYHKSECALCQVYEGTTTCHKFCPIREYGNHKICHNTPHDDFTRDRTPENALAELNFLRKVYIWWMEKEEGVKLVDYLRKEKKEEWENITRELVFEVEPSNYYKEPGDKSYFLRIIHDGNQIGVISGGQIKLFPASRYKGIYHNDVTRILKKT